MSTLTKLRLFVVFDILWMITCYVLFIIYGSLGLFISGLVCGACAIISSVQVYRYKASLNEDI